MSFDPPVNPFIGHVRSTGPAGAGAVQMVQLKNPAGSGKRLVVYKIRVTSHQAGGGTAILVKYRRTRTPTAPAGTTFPGKIAQTSSIAPTTPIAVLQASSDTPLHFTPADAAAQSVIQQLQEENAVSERPWPFRRTGAFPLSILPGSAFEAFAPADYVGHFRLNTVWDEVVYP